MLRDSVYLGVMSLRPRALALALTWVLVGAASAATAQAPTEGAAAPAEAERAPTEDEIARARAAYEAGLVATEEARWDDAERAFLEAYRLSRVSSALLNVAIAQRSLARYTAAEATLAELLARDDLDPELRARAEGLASEVAARVGRLHVRGLPDGATLYVDGEAREASGGTLAIRVDPGSHSVSAEAVGHAPFRWAGDVSAGGEAIVDVALVALPPPPEPTPLPSSPSAVESPWFWVVVIGVVLVAGGITGAVLGYDAAQPQAPACPGGVICVGASL